MTIAEVAEGLGVTSKAALRNVKSGAIPGGELLYRTERARRERWMVDRATFEAWQVAKGSNVAKGSTGVQVAKVANVRPRVKTRTG